MHRWRWGLVLGLLLIGMAPAWADRATDWYSTETKNNNTTDAQTDTTLWDPAAGKRFVILGIFVSADATETVQFEVSDVDVIPPIYVGANGSVSIPGGDGPIYMSAKDAVLTYTTTTSANTTVVVWGYEAE